MKKHILIILLTPILLNFNCEKDKEMKVIYETPKSQFADQNLQGKLFNKDWDFVQGYVEELNYSGQDSIYNGFYYNLHILPEDIPCSNPGGTIYVEFATKQLVKNLFDFDLTSGGDDYIYFYNTTGESLEIVVATEGKVEILNIDTVNQIVEGRIKAWESDENTIDGNFEVKICN